MQRMRQRAASSRGRSGPAGAMNTAVCALVMALATQLLAVPAVAQQSRTLKMQSTWPASLTLQDNFKFFAERVEKLTGGALKIEVNAAGQIVPPFEILYATHK